MTTNSNDYNNGRLIKAMETLKENNNIETTSAFLNVLLNIKLLVPITIDPESNTLNSDGTRMLSSGTKLNYRSVVNSDQENFLITFSDWTELKAWSKESKDAVLNDYFEIIDIVLNKELEFSGFVINPFSHNHVLNKKAITAINNAILK